MSSLGLGLAQPKAELPQNGSSGRQLLGHQYQVGAGVSWAPKKFKKIFLTLMMWEHVPNCMTEWYMCMWHHKSGRLLRWSTTLA